MFYIHHLIWFLTRTIFVMVRVQPSAANTRTPKTLGRPCPNLSSPPLQQLENCLVRPTRIGLARARVSFEPRWTPYRFGSDPTHLGILRVRRQCLLPVNVLGNELDVSGHQIVKRLGACFCRANTPG